jgi:predicted transposase/invertase (TIGR01784 family)
MKSIIDSNYIYPLTDTGFKVIFGTPKNKRLLIDFLNCLLKGEQTIVDIEYTDKEQVSDIREERDIIYDIFCKTDKGEYVIVEMQRQRQSNFIERTIYYAARALSRQGKKGRWNYDIKTVYCVAFMNFMIEKFGDNLCTDAELTIKGSNEQLSPVLRFFYIQLPLAKEEENAEYVTSLESWTYILHNMEALNLPRYSDNKIFNYLKEVTDVAALSPEQRRRYERDLTNYWDACALDEEYERRDKEYERKNKEYERRDKEYETREKNIKTREKEFKAREKEIENKKKEIENKKKEIENKKKEIENKKKEIENKKKEIENKKKEIENEGMKEAEPNKAISIARNMKMKRYPVEDISDMTGLSIEEINSISLN